MSELRKILNDGHYGEPTRHMSFNAVCVSSSNLESLPIGYRFEAAVPYTGQKGDEYFRTCAEKYTQLQCHRREATASFEYFFGDDTQIQAILRAAEIKRAHQPKKEETKEKEEIEEKTPSKLVDVDKKEPLEYDALEKLKQESARKQREDTKEGRFLQKLDDELPF